MIGRSATVRFLPYPSFYLLEEKHSVEFAGKGGFGVVRVASVRRVPTISPSAATLLRTTVRTRGPSLIICANSRVGNCNMACGNGNGRLRGTITRAVCGLLRPMAGEGVPFTIAFNGRSERINVSGGSRFRSVCGTLPGYVNRRPTRLSRNNNAYFVPVGTSSKSGESIFGLCLFSDNASTGNNKCRPFSIGVVS